LLPPIRLAPMTALVPETLDATAGRAQRTGLWGRAAWRWSLLAGLGLHVALVGAWWVSAQRAKPVVLPVPMQVRLAERAAHVSVQASARSELNAGVAPQPAAAQAKARSVQAPARDPSAQPVKPPLAQTLLPVLAPPVRPLPAPMAEARPQPAIGATVPTAPTAPVAPAVAATSPVSATPSAAPGVAPGAAPTHGPVATSPSPLAAEGAERTALPIEMPSSSVTYLVKPELTFPPGSEDLGEYGSVTLRLLVDDKGMVTTVQRLKSSGYARLDQHAVKVIRRARLTLHVVNGVPRAFWTSVTLNFNPP
jgi:protein TonB